VPAIRKGRDPPKRLLLTLGLLGACGLAALGSFQHPFTSGANLVTALALFVGLVAQVVCRFVDRARRKSGNSVLAAAPSDRGWRIQISWIVLAMAFTAFEFLQYLSEPRRAHPTFSSLSDELTSSQAGRAVLFLAWLALGALFVAPRLRHGAPAQSPQEASHSTGRGDP
jgi:hypothetical protein